MTAMDDPYPGVSELRRIGEHLNEVWPECPEDSDGNRVLAAADELASLRALKAKVDKAAEPVNRPSHWCDKPYADGWNQCLDWLRGGSDG